MAKKKELKKPVLANGANLNLEVKKAEAVKIPKKEEALKAIEVIGRTGLLGANELRNLNIQANRTLKSGKKAKK